MRGIYLKPYPGEATLVEAQDHTVSWVFADTLAECDEDTKRAATVLSVFVDTAVQAELLDALPSLELIATRSAGYDHIDTEAAAARGITVVRVPHYGTRTVAEYAFALMFALARHAYRAYHALRHDTHAVHISEYEGFDLAGKTLGVVGTGAIGSNVCRIAHGLGMRVCAHDPVPNEALQRECASLSYATLPELCAAADIVTVHVPALPETYHLIGHDEFSRMKNGVLFINTARGSVVDTLALVDALQQGTLAGAGLDVLEGEHELRDEYSLLTAEGAMDMAQFRTLAANHALIDMPNVIVTPHIAFNTKEAKREITDTTVANIAAFYQGRPQHVI